MNDVQERISILIDSGWTQQAIADELGVSWNGLRYWQRGERYPNNVKGILTLLDNLLQKKAPPKKRYPQGHYLQRRKAEQEG